MIDERAKVRQGIRAEHKCSTKVPADTKASLFPPNGKVLDVSNLGQEVFQLLLCRGILLGHLLVLRLPTVPFRLQGLYFALEVAGLDVRLSEPLG